MDHTADHGKGPKRKIVRTELALDDGKALLKNLLASPKRQRGQFGTPLASASGSQVIFPRRYHATIDDPRRTVADDDRRGHAHAVGR